MRISIAPSLLAADLSCLGDEIARAEEGGCDVFHVDIIDVECDVFSKLEFLQRKEYYMCKRYLNMYNKSDFLHIRTALDLKLARSFGYKA